QPVDEVHVPGGAAELAVGRRSQPGVLLHPDDLGDRLVLNGAQLGGGDLARGEVSAGIQQFLRPQQAADVVSPERRQVASGHGFPHITIALLSLYQSAASVSPFDRWTKELIDGREQEVGTVIEGWHDQALLGLLREALHAQRAVPPEFAEAGRSAFAWRDIDIALAQLNDDSTGDQEHDEAPLAETACLRRLAFRSARLGIELEVGPDCLIGRI